MYLILLCVGVGYILPSKTPQVHWHIHLGMSFGGPAASLGLSRKRAFPFCAASLCALCDLLRIALGRLDQRGCYGDSVKYTIIILIRELFQTMELASDSVCSSVTSEKEEESSVPQSLHWTTEQVAEWIESLGFKQYRVGWALTCNTCCNSLYLYCCIPDVHPWLRMYTPRLRRSVLFRMQ